MHNCRENAPNKPKAFSPSFLLVFLCPAGVYLAHRASKNSCRAASDLPTVLYCFLDEQNSWHVCFQPHSQQLLPMLRVWHQAQFRNFTLALSQPEGCLRAAASPLGSPVGAIYSPLNPFALRSARSKATFSLQFSASNFQIEPSCHSGDCARARCANSCAQISFSF